MQGIDIRSESYPQFLSLAKPIHVILVIDGRTFALPLIFCRDWCLAIDAIADRWGRLATVRLQFVSISSGTERVLLFEHRPGRHRVYAVGKIEVTVRKVRGRGKRVGETRGIGSRLSVSQHTDDICVKQANRRV